MRYTLKDIKKNVDILLEVLEEDLVSGEISEDRFIGSRAALIALLGLMKYDESPIEPTDSGWNRIW